MSMLSRVTNVFRPGRVHAELDEELEFHIEERTRELVAGGMSSNRARTEAQRQLGSRLQIRETSYDAKALVWLESLLRDARFSLRMLRKDRTVTAAAVLSLSLAMGLCTAAFSLIDVLILRPLPLPNPRELVELTYPEARPNGQVEEGDTFSYPLYTRLRQAAPAEIDLFGATFSPGFSTVTFAGSENEHNLRVETFSGSGFGSLGLAPALGRLFTSDEDRADSSNQVAVISHGLWMRQFAGASSVLGQWTSIGGKQYRIVGVAPQGFTGLQPGYLTDVWLPMVATVRPTRLASPDAEWVHVWGRVRRDRQLAIVQDKLQAAFTGFRREQLGTKFRDLPLRLNSAATGRASLFRKQFRQPLWILGLISVLILAIACSNVANLLIARGAARGREMALRIAIGAHRSRLVQQLLVESALLAAISCVVGLAFAGYAAPLVVAQLGPSDFPAYLDAGIDARVFGFAVLCAAATAVAFGLIPALRVSAVSPNLALSQESGRLAGKTHTLRAILSVQVAFSIAVLFLSGLLVTSFRKLMSVDVGFSKARVMLFDLAARQPMEPDARRAACAQLLGRVRNVPGVEAVSLSGMALMGGAFSPHISPQIRFPGGNWEAQRPSYMAVAPGFFHTMQIRLLSGREFEFTDAPTESDAAVIVNQAFAARYFAGRQTLGQRLEQRTDDPQRTVSLTIVGIAGNAHYNNLRETVEPTIYTPLLAAGGATLEVRTAVDPRGLSAALRQEIEGGNRSLKVTGMTLQATRIDDTVLSERLLAILGSLFAAMALLLVSVGLYGVIRYAAARRQKEVGIRLALGAPRQSVLRLMWSDVAIPVTLGLAVGIAGGLAAARFLESLLYEVRPTDLASLALPVACILLTSAAAILPPALRASRTDPMTVLRHE